MFHGLHFRDRGNRTLEIVETDPTLRRQLHAKKNGHAKTKRLKIQIQPPRLEDAKVIQPLHPTPRRRLAQPKLAPKGATGWGVLALNRLIADGYEG